MKTVEAIIEPNGEVHLVEPVHVLTPRRALVTILEESPTVHDAALLSEAALAEDWNGQVVIVHFPFSDLTASKLRPAVVLAEAGRGDC